MPSFLEAVSFSLSINPSCTQFGDGWGCQRVGTGVWALWVPSSANRVSQQVKGGHLEHCTTACAYSPALEIKGGS